jgi:hypothetical protein
VTCTVAQQYLKIKTNLIVRILFPGMKWSVILVHRFRLFEGPLRTVKQIKVASPLLSCADTRLNAISSYAVPVECVFKRRKTIEQSRNAPNVFLRGNVSSVRQRWRKNIAGRYNGTPLSRYAPHNDVSVKYAPNVRRWSHKIII